VQYLYVGLFDELLICRLRSC